MPNEKKLENKLKYEMKKNREQQDLNENLKVIF